MNSRQILASVPGASIWLAAAASAVTFECDYVPEGVARPFYSGVWRMAGHGEHVSHAGVGYHLENQK